MSSTTIADGDLTKDEILVKPDNSCNTYEWELWRSSGVTRISSLAKPLSGIVVELKLKPMIVTSNDSTLGFEHELHKYTRRRLNQGWNPGWTWRSLQLLRVVHTLSFGANHCYYSNSGGMFLLIQAEGRITVRIRHSHNILLHLHHHSIR